MGGLPSRIEWTGSGKVFDTFSLNDRVWDPATQGFQPKDDKNPEVKLVANGPVRAVVRVRARFMRDGQAAPANVVGTYDYAYYVGSPVVRVAARFAQDSLRVWPELHFIEINFPDQSFTRWAYGDPVVEGAFEANKKGFGGGSWSALRDDAGNTLGLLGGDARFYDGRGEYGTYMHGPWVTWADRQQSFVRWLWVGTAPNLDGLRTAAQSVQGGSEAIVSTQVFQDKLAAVRGRIAKLPSGARRGQFAWVTDQIEKLADKRWQIAEATDLIGKVGTALAEGKQASDAVPWFGFPKAASTWSKHGLTLLANDEVGLGLERTGDGVALVSLFSFAAEHEMLIGKRLAFWSADCEAPGATAAAAKAKIGLGSLSGWGDVSVSGRAPGEPVTLTFSNPVQPEAAGVQAKVQIGFEGGRTTWHLDIDNGSPTLSLRDIYIPTVQLGKMGRTPADDSLVYPQGSGIITHAPLVKGFTGYGGRYPDGWASMQFIAYYGPGCGAYVATHDPLASTKELHVERAEDSIDVKMRWYAEDCGVPGNSFHQSGTAALQVFRGDWFDATQIYKDWVSKNAGWWPKDRDRGDTPKWMRDIPIWTQTGGTAAEVVPATKKFAEYMGLPTAVHWYSWHQIPFDVNYPHYFPVKPGFKEGVAELQKAGVRVMPYINGRLWDSALDDFKNDAIRGATKDEQGKPYIEEYGSGAKLAPMCPTQAIWRDKVQETVMRLVSEYGVDGVYIDQVAAAAPVLCFDKSHGHPLGGGNWWTAGGYWPMLTELRAKIKAAGLEKFLTTECNGEAYIHCFDGYLTWHFQYQNQIPMFASVYAGRIQPFSRAYGGDEVAQCMKAGQQLVFGEQLGWCAPQVVTERPKFAAFIRQCARIRYAMLDCLSRGDMARPPVLKGDIPTVTADWQWGGKSLVTTDALLGGAWKSEGGKLAVIFANVTEQPVKADWVFDAAQYGFPQGKKLQMALRTEGGIAPAATVESRFTKTLEVPGRTVWAFEIAP
jgi:hypothetical protein